MPPSLQAKCFRVLQDGEVIAVGDVHPRRVDVRVLSATNRDLRAEVSASRFRQDLYHRIAVFAVHVPPLRERREDVSLLAARMAATTARREDRKIGGIDPEAVAVLERYDWPGNVRELANEMERAVALTADGEAISVRHLSPHLQNLGPEGMSGPAAPAGPGGRASSLRQRRAAFEARYISEVLRQSEGNVSRAARALGLSRVTLYKRLREYGIR
jgi:transcriptional regulator with PAS, ATPase and Fis domain